MSIAASSTSSRPTAHRARRAVAVLALAAALALGACGSGGGAGGGPGAPDGGAAPAPLEGLQPGVWRWIDEPASACDDGSPTGFGVSAGTGPDLVVFLNGGGACWDYLTCYVLGTASRGPYGLPQFQALQASTLTGSILDRALPGNPFRDATLVFVPYCTGDIHGGSRVAAYTSGSTQRTFHHVGHANLVAFLGRVAATWPSPRKLVVSGSSAGGFGAVVNYPTVRAAWPAAQAYLVDDSGPPLGRGAIPQWLLDAWYASWNLGAVLDPSCGVACRTDLSAGLAAVARGHPADRLALLSSLQDQVISGYFLIGGAQLEQGLDALATDVIAPTANARFFYVAGSTHTMLGNPAAFSQGVPLLTWLQQQVGDDPAWVSRRP